MVSYIDDTAKLGERVQIGRYCIIERDCHIGDDCKLGDYVKLMPGTCVGDRVHIDDYANSSGAMRIGNDVLVKRMTCLTQGTLIEDRVFVGPGVMIIHEGHVSYFRDVDKASHGVHICAGAIIGGGALLNAGVTIAENAVVGAGAVVTRDCELPWIYVGNPARPLREVPDELLADLEGIAHARFEERIVREYLPELFAVGRLTVP